MSPQRRVILYHRTTAENARAILDCGFSDSSGSFLDNRLWTGVWFSSIPVGSEVADGEVVLTVKVEIDDLDLARWEWTGEGRSYREWLIPASIVNQRASVELTDPSIYSTVEAEVSVEA